MPQTGQALDFTVAFYDMDSNAKAVTIASAKILDVDGSVLVASPTFAAVSGVTGLYRYTLAGGANDAIGTYTAQVIATDDGTTTPLTAYDEKFVEDVLVASLVDGAITAAKIADGALTAAKFAAGAFDAVWSVAARLLTAGTNIALVKGTGVTGFNDLSAGDVRDAVGLASADLDTQLGALSTFDPASETVDVGAVGGSAVTSPDDFKADVSGLATATALATVGTNVSTLLARIGAFTGTGVNTILGFLKALGSKAASTPSDMGGTYDASSDSLEAVSDAGVAVDLSPVTAVTDKLDTALESDGAGGYQFTTLGLENAPAGGAGGSCDEAAIADDVAAQLLAAGTTINILSLVGADGTITIRHGDAYNADNANGLLTLTVTSSGIDVTTFDADSLQFSLSDLHGDSPPLFTVDETDGIVRLSTTQIQVPLTSAQTSLPRVGGEYYADVQGTQNGDADNKVTCFFGRVLVRLDVTP